MSEYFKYVDSPYTDFNVPDKTQRDFDPVANTVTYQGFEVENLTEDSVGDVYAALPFVWSLVTKEDSEDSLLGKPGYVALDFEVDAKGGAWTAENFNRIDGLNLRVTAEIVPLDHHYTTGEIAAGNIFSDASLTDVFGPTSRDDPVNAKLPPETLDGDDKIPSVNLGTLEADEEVEVDLVFTYEWTLDGVKVEDYNALRTAGYVVTLDPVEPTAGAVDDLWPV
jgi:hypothetical protein